WKLVDREGIEAFGTSARFIGACRTQGLNLRPICDFSHLRVVFSTGSPLLPEDFDYFYRFVCPEGRSIPLQSISGGTDILSCFMLGNPLEPGLGGRIQGRSRGMDVRAFGPQRQSLRGEQGAL